MWIPNTRWAPYRRERMRESFTYVLWVQWIPRRTGGSFRLLFNRGASNQSDKKENFLLSSALRHFGFSPVLGSYDGVS
jgi:hypothetical protein